MATRRLWFPVLVLLGMALASASATSPTVPEYRVLRTQYSVLSTQQPPADPLPPGAKLRLGTTRMRDPGGWSGAVLTPDGQHLLAFPSAGPARIEVATGALGKPLKPPPGVFGGRTDLAPDGKRAVTVAFNGAVVWEIDTGASVARVDRRTPFGEGAAALSADGKTLAVGGVKDDQAKDKPVTALVWDIEKNAKRAEVIVLQNQSASVALSADGKLLATWGTHFDPTPGRPDPEKEFGRFVQFWDATSGKELGRTRLPGYGAPVVAFAPDGKMAAVANGTGTVLLVDPRTGSVGRQLFGRYGSGVRVAFSPDGKLLAAAASDGAVQVWQAADGKLAATVDCPLGLVLSGPREIRFTAPDRAVAWGVIGSTAVVWEVPSGKLLSVTAGHTGSLTGVAFAAGGKEVLTGGQDALILRWDAASGKELGEVAVRSPGGIGGVRTQFGSVAFGPGAAVAVVDRGGGRGIYDLASGTQLAALPSSFETRPVIAPDARTLFLAPLPPTGTEQPKTIKIPVWDTATGAKLAELELPAGDLAAATITPDRTKLITALVTRAGKDGKSELLVSGWDLTAGGKKLGELAEKGGYGSVYLTAAPDNKTVLLNTPDGRLVAVDVTTGKAVREFDTTQLRATAAAVFAPDRKSVAVGLGGGFGASGPATIRVYDAESGKPTRTFRGHTGPVTCLAFSPDGKTLATGSNDTTVLLWDLAAAGE